MTTIVFLHAHPDDEASQTSGAMARASAQGDRVVVVFATNGDHGEVPADLAEGQSVADHRKAEALRSAAVLGLARVAWLEYADSGMTGWEQNEAEQCFHRADLDEAASRLAAILDEEDADVLVGYDWHGGYGHPDHVKVHHVAHAAAARAARTPKVLESTMNRTAMRELIARGRELDPESVGDFDPDKPMDDGNPMGTLAEDIQWQVDVTDQLDAKRAAMAAHASQASDIGQMLSMPDFAFAAMFGHEHYLEPGVTAPMRQGWPFTPAGTTPSPTAGP